MSDDTTNNNQPGNERTHSLLVLNTLILSILSIGAIFYLAQQANVPDPDPKNIDPSLANVTGQIDDNVLKYLLAEAHKEIVKLKTDIVTLNTECAAAKKLLRETHAEEVKGIKAELATCKAELTQLSKNFAKINGDMEKEKAALKKKIATLEKQIVALTEKLKNCELNNEGLSANGNK